MNKKILVFIFILLLIIFILFFSYKINTYIVGQKFISDDGRIYLVFDQNIFYKKINLLNKNIEVKVNIINTYILKDYTIYQVDDNLTNFNKIIAIKERISLITYLIQNIYL